jgi:hypothetical protein
MNSKNIKISLLIIGIVACGLGSLFFAASFALAELQSWPKALWEARTILLGGVVMGINLTLAKGRLGRYLYTGARVALLVSFLGFTWTLGGTHGFWYCLWGIVSYVIAEGILIAKLMTTVSQAPKVQTQFVTVVDPSLN